MMFLPPKGKLLRASCVRECARPLAESTRHEIADNRACNPDRVNAVVVIKTRILARENSVDEIVGDLVEGNHDAVLSRPAGYRISHPCHRQMNVAACH